MYIQPYEPQEYGFGTTSFDGYSIPEGPISPGITADSIAPAMSWTNQIPGMTDAAGSLEDAPFGQFGLGPMLQNLTGMMQQILQMMQSLVGRLSSNGEGGLFGHVPPHRLPNGSCGCTQSMQPENVRYPLDAP
jgi:hypothetical protein